MVKLKAPTRKMVVPLVGVVLLIMVIIAATLAVIHKRRTETATKNKVASALKGVYSGDQPSDTYTNKLNDFVKTTKDDKERAKAYIMLADSYNLRKEYQKALDAYKSAKKLGNSVLTTEQTKLVDERITALESYISAASKPYTGTHYYGEGQGKE